MNHPAHRGPVATTLASLIVTLVAVSCGHQGTRDVSVAPSASTSSVAPSASTSSAAGVSGPAPGEVTPTSTTIDPLSPTTLPLDSSLPPCVEAQPNLLLTPVGDVTVAHVTVKIHDPGVTGLTDGGYPVLNAVLTTGDECQVGDGPTQRVTAEGRAPRWIVVFVDGALPDASAGSDVAHLTGRNLTTGEFYNCANTDPTVNLAEALAAIVSTSSLTCRSSLSIHAT